jgi:hypothetical protein
MWGDPPNTAREIHPGVYLMRFSGAGDGILVDRTRAEAQWAAVADVVIEPRPGDDLELLVSLSLNAYRLRFAGQGFTPIGVPPPETA